MLPNAASTPTSAGVTLPPEVWAQMQQLLAVFGPPNHAVAPFTTNICNSAQKENVKLGWAKHIPNFTENGQK